MAHLFIDNVCVNCGCDSGKVGAGQPCPNPSEGEFYMVLSRVFAPHTIKS